MSFPVPESLRTAATQAAAREGKSVSELAREALERYLVSRSGTPSDPEVVGDAPDEVRMSDVVPGGSVDDTVR